MDGQYVMNRHLTAFDNISVCIYRCTLCISLFLCARIRIWEFETEEGARIADVRGDMASIAQSWRQGKLQEMQLQV